MSNYLKRLKHISRWLKVEPVSINDILKRLESKGMAVSRRQLHRDLGALQPMLDDYESLNSFFKAGKKFFYIQNSLFKSESPEADATEIYHTNFYKQNITHHIQSNLKLTRKAITERKSLKIKLIKDDETSDNTDIDARNIVVCPIKIVYHRGSYYLACFNDKSKQIEIFGLRQLKNLELGKVFDNFKVHEKQVLKELKTRFGVTKNINNKVYDIELKFTPVLGRFIENHHWHTTQKIKCVDGDYVMNLKCGINRELMGWLFQWMYNVKIVKPRILKNIYQKTLEETKLLFNDERPFVYRNIFIEKIDDKL
ncbi:MAG: WYL domain-containing protein [Bacteroidetes bacterium]|jgi:predicted DNA-binding transcriptional regulator YafY|nr:WYL domain-containing protein [Bacteroidota bacterium]